MSIATPRTVAGVSVTLAAVLLVCRGLALYRRNEVTISITELVRLPPAAAAVAAASLTSPRGRGRRSLHAERASPSYAAPGAAVIVRGKVEVETCVMRSYRFLLKLVGVVRSERFAAANGIVNPAAAERAAQGRSARGRSHRTTDAAGGALTSTRHVSSGALGTMVSRHRVFSSAMATAAADAADSETGSMAGGDDGSSSSYFLSDSFSAASSHRGGSRSGKERRQPTIVVESASDMVDVFEMDLSGHLNFTPSCIMGDTLITYIASPAPALLQPATSPSGSPTLSRSSASAVGLGSRLSSSVMEPPDGGDSSSASLGASQRMLSAALTGGPDGAGNVCVRSCYLQADISAPHSLRLSFELEVRNPVQGLQLLVTLPHRRCRLLSADTGATGRVRQPLQRKQRHLVWDIGDVQRAAPPVSALAKSKVAGAYADTTRRAPSVEDSSDPASTGRLRTQGRRGSYDGDDDAAAASLAADSLLSDPQFGLRLLIAHCSIVYWQPPDAVDGESSSSSLSSSADDDDDDDSDRASDEWSVGDADADEQPVSGRRPRSDSASALRRARGANSPQTNAGKGRQRGTPSAPNSSDKARRRETRHQQQREARQRRRSEAIVSARGASTRVPTAELTYSVNGLASGTSVKRLHVLKDQPNWVARSFIDRWLFKKLLGGLEEIKLQRFAHYTTWFVQPVTVTQLR